MTILEMVWAVVILILGGMMIELRFAERSGVKAFTGIMKKVKKHPLYIKFAALENNPNFEKFILETIDSVHRFNKLMKKIEKEGILSVVK